MTAEADKADADAFDAEARFRFEEARLEAVRKTFGVVGERVIYFEFACSSF